jgi:LuxR family maltose regulon positive regulatory protein
MQNAWLTQTKFVSPQQRDDFVPRNRLLDTLHTAINSCALTLLSAPAGYGKTTLLASLSDKPLAWISIDEEDNDPARFFIALLRALQKLDPGFGEDIQSLLSSLENPANESRRIISAFINEVLEKLPETLLVFDDLHLISEPVIYSALDYLLEYLPSQMHLIIATRHDPPLSLARLRARGQLAEFRVPDLRFTTNEASLFLNEKQRLGLSSEDLTKLQSRAEGWAAGLRLLAGSLDKIPTASDRATFIQDLAVSDRYVFEFLADEVLKRQEPEMRTFLLETSILPEITPWLCAAVTGRSDAQAVLEELYRRNLFLIQAGGLDRTYRYHALFAEFLREQLEQEMPERIVELHQCAAEAQKTVAPTRSIAHYLAAELWNDAAQTIDQVSGEFVRQGFIKTLHDWIERLPIPVRDTHPRFLYVLGMSALHQGELNDALTLLESARRRFETSGDQSNLAEVLLLMIDTASRQHDYVRQADLTQEALAIPLPVHGRVQLLMAKVWQSLFQSDFQQADEALDQALDLTLGSNDIRAFSVMAPIVNLHLAFLPGGAVRLEHFCREVLAYFGKGVSAIHAGTLSMQACLLFLNGALEQAAGAADEARSICKQLGGLAYSDLQARFVQAQVAEAHRDYAKVEELWREALPLTEQIPALNPFVVTALYFIGRTQWMQKKFDQARQTETHISTIVDPSEFPENTVVRQLIRALIEITDYKFEDAERTLQQGIATELKWPHAVAFGSARVMLAYLRLQQKREQDAWLQFKPFLAECEQRNRAGLILRETTLAIPLLHLAIEKKSHVDFAQRLLDQLSASDSPKPVSIPETGETLTVREVEVLELIAEGASNQVIAQRLVISQHTVKAHITRIYAKLQVTSRTEAAARARELRLV